MFSYNHPLAPKLLQTMTLAIKVFGAFALVFMLSCYTATESARAADSPAASPPADTPDFVNGKWLGTVHTKYGDRPEIVTTITKRANEGAACKTLLEYARDADGHPLICLNDTPQSDGSRNDK